MRKARRLIYPLIYASAVLIVGLCVILVGRTMSAYLDKNQDYDYTTKEVFENTTTNDVPKSIKIAKPYTEGTVKVVKDFYDYKATDDKQQKSIIYYENTYMQNSGVDYNSDKSFDVLAVLDGEVINIKNDKTLGNIVEIKHNNNLITVYQGIEQLTIKNGDTITQNSVLGKSSKSKIYPEYKNHFHFEVYYKGEVIDPNSFFDKELTDFQ